MDDYRMLAEHLGKNEQVRVIISGTEAKLEGTTIYLPEDVPAEIQNVLLATLLHESYQIRFTDKRNEYEATKGEEHRHNLLNVLEDIRLDRKVIQDWPNAWNLYLGLVGYYDEKHAASMAALPWQVQVLQRLVRLSYGPGFEKHQPSARGAQDWLSQNWLSQNATFAEDLVKRAQAAPTTPDLYPMIDELIAKLFPEDPEAEKQKKAIEDAIKNMEQAAKDKADERREAQAEAKKEFEEAKDLDAQARDLEKEAAREKGQAKEGKAKAKDKKAEGKAKREKGDAAGAAVDEAEADKMDEEADGQAEQAKKNEAKADELNKQAAPKYEKLEKLQKDYEEAKKEQADAQGKAAAAHAEKEKMDGAQNEAAKEGLQGLAAVGIGFEKIAAEDLKVVKLIPENIQDEVLNFLRCREERRINASEGRIDPKKLATFYNPDNLFVQDLQNGHYKTRVHFLVDVSGSMSDRMPGDDKIMKWNMAGQAVTNIADAIEKGIEMDGLEIEYGIFGFDTEAHEIKGFEKKLDKEMVLKSLAPRGGTSPRSVIEDVEAKHQPDNCRTKQVVFMITDGQFGEEDYKCLEQRLGGAIKWIFLGLDVSTEDKKSRDLFGKYNIVAAKDMKKALGRALIDNLD